MNPERQQTTPIKNNTNDKSESPGPPCDRTCFHSNTTKHSAISTCISTPKTHQSQKKTSSAHKPPHKLPCFRENSTNKKHQIPSQQYNHLVSASLHASTSTHHQKKSHLKQYVPTAHLHDMPTTHRSPSQNSRPPNIAQTSSATQCPSTRIKQWQCSTQSLEHRHLRKGPEAVRWTQANSSEIARLARGDRKEEKGTNTTFCMPHTALPAGRKATCLRVAAACCPQKEDLHRIRWTADGDRIDCPGKASTPAAGFATAKGLLNGMISMPGARGMGLDTKCFYLNTDLERCEHMWVPENVSTDNVRELCKLGNLIHNGRALVEIRKGMCGPPQSGLLTHEKTKKHPLTCRCFPCKRTPGLQARGSKNISFTLVADGFAVKCTNKRDADHLLQAIGALHKFTTDWELGLCCGMTLKWNCDERTVELFMPGHVKNKLPECQHPEPCRPERAPHSWLPTKCGQRQQEAMAEDISELLDKTGKTRVQQIVGSFQCHAQAIDLTVLVALGTLASDQASPTKNTNKAMPQFLNHAATSPDATIKCHASNMTLDIHSDASHASDKGARSRAGGHFQLTKTCSDIFSPPKPDNPLPFQNGPLHTLSTGMKMVLRSAAEAELAAPCFNCKDACKMRMMLEELGHPQPPTCVQTDNTTAAGITNGTTEPK